MNKQKWLKIVNGILFLLIFWMLTTAILHEKFEKAFEILHPPGGLLLVIFTIIHLILNFGWIKSSFRKK